MQGLDLQDVLDTARGTSEVIADNGPRPVAEGPVDHVIMFASTNTSEGEYSTLNVFNISLSDTAVDGTPQQGAFFDGSATGESNIQNALEGVTGHDIPASALEAYRHLAVNYQEGDSITIMGASRGGLTSLVLATVIDEIGIIDTTGMTPEEIDAATEEAIRLSLDPNVEPGGPEILAFQEQYNIHPEDPQINMGLIDPVGTQTFLNYDINVGVVDNIFVVSALDETNNLLDELHLGALSNTTVTYFIGDHSTLVGTVPAEAGLSAIPARDLAEDLGLNFEPVIFDHYIPEPDPLLPVTGSFGQTAVPVMNIGGHDVRPTDPNGQLHPSIIIRDEEVEGYNPPQLQDPNNTLVFAVDEPLIDKPIITAVNESVIATIDKPVNSQQADLNVFESIIGEIDDAPNGVGSEEPWAASFNNASWGEELSSIVATYAPEGVSAVTKPLVFGDKPNDGDSVGNAITELNDFVVETVENGGLFDGEVVDIDLGSFNVNGIYSSFTQASESSYASFASEIDNGKDVGNNGSAVIEAKRDEMENDGVVSNPTSNFVPPTLA